MSVNATSNYLLDYLCFSDSVKSMFNVMRALLLFPLSTFVFYLGYQEWRRQHSFKSASHSDVFTYHMAAMELIWVLGCFIKFGGTYSDYYVMATVASAACVNAYYGEFFFHVLTCVERYLAVVHPITYLGLRHARGVRIRNISIGCVWVLCFGLTAMHRSLKLNYNLIPLLCLVIFSIIITSFCNLSVLCVLIRPGPGEGGRENERVDQLRQRAFYTITAITCAVWFWFVGLLVTKALSKSPLLSSTVRCLIEMSVDWFNLPSSLVLPLLYLKRMEKFKIVF